MNHESPVNSECERDESDSADRGSLESAPGDVSERVFYRDEDEFNEALNAAADQIAKIRGKNKASEHLASGALWFVILLLCLLIGADKVLSWDLRHMIIPGVDLVDPLIAIIAGFVVWYFVWRRRQHTPILRDRQCLRCGVSLKDISTDEQGDGACPKCARKFNLGEYRKPEENRGHHFHGYLDEDHFDKTLYAVARQIRKTHDSGLEYELMGWGWIALGISFFGHAILNWDLYTGIPYSPPVHAIGLVTLLIWSGWYTARMKKQGPSIIEHRRCMNCGYSLLHTSTDEKDYGRCPECGEVFTLKQYEKPPPEGEEEEKDLGDRS